jgi:hypothetical protein
MWKRTLSTGRTFIDWEPRYPRRPGAHGPRPLPESALHTCQIKISLTPSEYADLVFAVEETGLSKQQILLHDFSQRLRDLIATQVPESA